MEHRGVGVLETPQTLLQHSITPSPLLRHSEEFLPDPQLRILGKKDFGDEDLVRCELTRRDGFAVFDSLLRVNENRGGFFDNSVVIGPLCQDVPCGIHQVNFDPLVGWKIERGRTLRQICQRHLHSKLTNLRELYRLRCDLQIEGKPTQPWIFVLRDHFGRKWMENAAQPTALPCRSRRRRDLMGKDASSQKNNQEK